MADFDHWMKWNIGDYLADTMHLTTLQHGIYVRLIMHYFKRGPLPDDEKLLARIAGISPLIWRRSSAHVMALFRLENGVWLHGRIERVRSEAARLTKRKRIKRGLDPEGDMEPYDSRVSPRTRARATNHSQSESDSPRRPPTGGRGARNAFVDSAMDDMRANDEATGDARRRGSVVVPITRRSDRR